VSDGAVVSRIFKAAALAAAHCLGIKPAVCRTRAAQRAKKLPLSRVPHVAKEKLGHALRSLFLQNFSVY
jgi:hypothetical protein